MSDAASSVQSQAAELKRTVSHEASRVTRQTRQSVTEATDRLRSEGTALFTRQRDAAAEELAHLRDALDAASEKLSEHDDRRIADLTHVAADRLDAVSEYLRQHDINDFASDLSQAARQRPVLFYGGLFAIGIAASRFLKASSHRTRGNAAMHASQPRGY